MRKLPCRSAACAVPRWNATSPSTSASSICSRARASCSSSSRSSTTATLPSGSSAESRDCADHVLVAETIELRVAHTELGAQDLVGVLAQHRCGAVPVTLGPGRHAHRPRGVLVHTDDRVLYGFEEAARPHLRVVERQ